MRITGRIRTVLGRSFFLTIPGEPLNLLLNIKHKEMHTMFYDRVKELAEYIQARIPHVPSTGVILGSGLGSVVEAFMRFRRKREKLDYDRENLRPVIRSSICTGERVAGFQNIHTGKFTEVMLIREDQDLREFLETYGLSDKQFSIRY